MREMLGLLVVVASLLFPALASELDELQDCEDWVFLVPGLYCTPVPGMCTPTTEFPEWGPWCRGQATTLDPLGFVYHARRVLSEPCPNGTMPLGRIELWRLNEAGVEELVAYVSDECVTGTDRVDRIVLKDEDALLPFDPSAGRILIPVESNCRNLGGSSCGTPKARWMAAIVGFATAMEVLHTYEPASTDLTFRVPYMPEGFQHADYFDTYYGSLGTVGDWTQAQPLQCGYPATAPEVGDYLTVTDTLPTPGPGEGYYYVTAVHYGGETRYGRKCVNGVLSGRDPGGLPGCTTWNEAGLRLHTHRHRRTED